MRAPSEVTQLLRSFGHGDREALDRLLPRVYGELRRVARGRLRGEQAGHTLGTTALVHEAYLRLARIQRVAWRDRKHFFAVASRVMRRVLVDHARRRNAAKRGGGWRRTELEGAPLMSDAAADAFLELDDSLQRLESDHPRAARVLEHLYFAGFTQEETAEALEVSVSTVKRDLRFARAWLAREWGR